MSRVDLGVRVPQPHRRGRHLLLSKLIKVVFIAVLIERSLCDNIKSGTGNSENDCDFTYVSHRVFGSCVQNWMVLISRREKGERGGRGKARLIGVIIHGGGRVTKLETEDAAV